MLDFGQFDFGQFDFGQLAEIELAEVEIGRSRTDGVCSVSSFSLSCFFFYFVFILFCAFFLVLTHLSLHFVVDRAAGARTRQPKNSKRAHFRAPAFQTPPKFHENCGGKREKKAQNFWAPHPSGSTLRGSTLRGSTLRGSTLRGPTLRGPTLRGPHPSGPHPSGPHPSGPHPSGPHPSGPILRGPTFSGGMKTRISHVSAASHALPAPHWSLQETSSVQLSRLRHLRNHALRTSSRTFSSADSALAFDRAARKSAVSPDHLPPTSAPNTTRRARPRSPTNSGQVLSFLLRASSNAAPLWSAALLRAVPSRCNGDTMVVSMAN